MASSMSSRTTKKSLRRPKAPSSPPSTAVGSDATTLVESNDIRSLTNSNLHPLTKKGPPNVSILSFSTYSAGCDLCPGIATLAARVLTQIKKGIDIALDEISIEIRLREIERQFNDPSFSALGCDWTQSEHMRMLADILELSKSNNSAFLTKDGYPKRIVKRASNLIDESRLLHLNLDSLRELKDPLSTLVLVRYYVGVYWLETDNKSFAVLANMILAVIIKLFDDNPEATETHAQILHVLYEEVLPIVCDSIAGSPEAVISYTFFPGFLQRLADILNTHATKAAHKIVAMDRECPFLMTFIAKYVRVSKRFEASSEKYLQFIVDLLQTFTPLVIVRPRIGEWLEMQISPSLTDWVMSSSRQAMYYKLLQEVPKTGDGFSRVVLKIIISRAFSPNLPDYSPLNKLIHRLESVNKYMTRQAVPFVYHAIHLLEENVDILLLTRFLNLLPAITLNETTNSAWENAASAWLRHGRSASRRSNEYEFLPKYFFLGAAVLTHRRTSAEHFDLLFNQPNIREKFAHNVDRHFLLLPDLFLLAKKDFLTRRADIDVPWSEFRRLIQTDDFKSFRLHRKYCFAISRELARILWN